MLSRAKLRAAIGLMAPMGDMLEAMQACLEAHHPAGHTADECPVCVAFQERMLPILDRWMDARAQAEEHWDV